MWVKDKIKFKLGLMYDQDFYNEVDRLQLNSIIPIVNSLIEKYQPNSVIDIGCGNGIYLEEFHKRNIKTFGLDNSREGIKRCEIKGLNAKRINIIRNKIDLPNRFDLAICFEVAEHLPNDFSDTLIKLLSNCSDTVIFTAALPGQGGINHINEQHHSFWIDKFRNNGYALKDIDTEELRKNWRINNVVNYMITNLMVFKKCKL